MVIFNIQNLNLLSANRPKNSTDTVVASIGASVSAIFLRHDVSLVINTPEGPGLLLKAQLPGAGTACLEAAAVVASVHMRVVFTNTMRITFVINTFVSRIPSYMDLRIILRTHLFCATAPS